MTSKEGKGSSSLAARLNEMLAPSVQAMGYDLIDLEYQGKSPQGGPVLRAFIDFLSPAGSHIGIEDCVRVDRGLTDLLNGPEMAELLPADFTLEVSSPGVDRPLTRPEHFTKFTGKKARVKTFRALTEEELGNAAYFELHQRQKNFGGILRGWNAENVLMEVDREQIRIPFEQIAKAHLDLADDLLQNEDFLNDKQRKNKKR